MPRPRTDEFTDELVNEYRVIPAYPDYEVNMNGKVRNKTSKLQISTFMDEQNLHKGTHVTLFVQGVRETIDVWSLVKNAFDKGAR